MRRKHYTLKEPRFQPYKDIYIDVGCMKKICSKCGGRYPLNDENFSRDYQREYGYMSQCKTCQKEYQRSRRTLKMGTDALVS